MASATATGSTSYSPFSICSFSLAAFIAIPPNGLYSRGSTGRTAYRIRSGPQSSSAASVQTWGSGQARASPSGVTDWSFAKMMIRCAALYSGLQADSTSRSYPTLRVTHRAVGSTIFWYCTT
jgi:hypothetical protein